MRVTEIRSWLKVWLKFLWASFVFIYSWFIKYLWAKVWRNSWKDIVSHLGFFPFSVNARLSFSKMCFLLAFGQFCIHFFFFQRCGICCRKADSSWDTCRNFWHRQATLWLLKIVRSYIGWIWQRRKIGQLRLPTKAGSTKFRFKTIKYGWWR